jgi:hypothetical protein
MTGPEQSRPRWLSVLAVVVCAWFGTLGARQGSSCTVSRALHMDPRPLPGRSWSVPRAWSCARRPDVYRVWLAMRSVGRHNRLSYPRVACPKRNPTPGDTGVLGRRAEVGPYEIATTEKLTSRSPFARNRNGTTVPDCPSTMK